MSYLAKLSNGVLLESESLKTVYNCAMFEMRNEIDRSGTGHPYRAIDAVILRVEEGKLYGDYMAFIGVSTLSVFIRDMVTDRKVQYFRGELKEVEKK